MYVTLQKKVNVLQAYVDQCDNRMFLNLHLLVPPYMIPYVTRMYIAGHLYIGKLRACRCQSENV